MSEALLPPDSGAATSGYARIWAIWSELGPLIGTIKSYGIAHVPDDWVPWFIWDLGLEDVVPYVRDYRRALAEGPEWQRTRGTDRGIEIGIGWVESAGKVAAPDQRHSWWEFQVGFDVPASDIEQLQQLFGIINLSKAAEDELFRMFSPGADYRPVRMDLHRMDEGLMDGYSGERLWEGGPIISMGWVGAYATSADTTSEFAMQRSDASAVFWFEGLRLDADRMGETRPATLNSVAVLALANDDYLFDDDVWPLRWPQSWEEAAEPHSASTSWGDI